MISCVVLDNVCIYIVQLHFTVYYLAFHKFIIQIYVNVLILLLYQAKSHTMDVHYFFILYIILFK